MIQNLGNLGVNVPGGFATTSDAYRGFLAHENLGNRINALLDELDVDDLDALAKTGKQIRDWLMNVPLQESLENDINIAYEKLVEEYGDDVTWAVRSSATAEDLPLLYAKSLRPCLRTVRSLTACIKILTMLGLRFLLAFKKWYVQISPPVALCLP